MAAEIPKVRVGADLSQLPPELREVTCAALTRAALADNHFFREHQGRHTFLRGCGAFEPIGAQSGEQWHAIVRETTPGATERRYLRWPADEPIPGELMQGEEAAAALFDFLSERRGRVATISELRHFIRTRLLSQLPTDIVN